MLTTKTVEKVARVLLKGNTLSTTAEKTGVSVPTVRSIRTGQHKALQDKLLKKQLRKLPKLHVGRPAYA